MEPNGFNTCLLSKSFTMPSDRGLAKDHGVFGLARKYLAALGGILGHELFNVGPNRIYDGVGAIAVRGLGAREDYLMGIVLDAGATLDMEAVMLEVAPAKAEAFGDAKAVIE